PHTHTHTRTHTLTFSSRQQIHLFNLHADLIAHHLPCYKGLHDCVCVCVCVCERESDCVCCCVCYLAHIFLSSSLSNTARGILSVFFLSCVLWEHSVVCVCVCVCVCVFV